MPNTNARSVKDLSSYVVRAVYRVDVFDTRGNYLSQIPYVETANISNTQEENAITYQGTPLAFLSYGKACEMTLQTKVITDVQLEMQAGTDIEVHEDYEYSAMYTSTVKNGVADVKVSGELLGYAGDEIGEVYLLDSNGAKIDTFTQAEAVGDHQFTYDAKSKKMRFQPDAIPENGKVTFNALTKLKDAKVIKNVRNKFSRVAKVVVTAAISDICNQDEEFLADFIFPNAKFDGNWNIEIDGENADGMNEITISSMKQCGIDDDSLWDLVIRDAPAN